MADNKIDDLLEVATLIYRRRTGGLTAEEQVLLQAWLDADAAHRALYGELIREDLVTAMLEEQDPAALRVSALRVYAALGMETGVAPVWRREGPEGEMKGLEGRMEERKMGRLRRISEMGWAGEYRKWWAAAAVVLAVCIGGYLLLADRQGRKMDSGQPAIVKQDVAAPVGTKTTLTLASGEKVILDSVQNGELAKEGGAEVSKPGSGELTYMTKGGASVMAKGGQSAQILYNTLTTARGGQTMVQLADGTKVWLNALSSLRYPTAFAGKIREVELTGEAYFEVSHRVAKPFRVKVRDALIEDIGTHFNINAYTEESLLNTTLLEGSVRVDGRVLKPGEQAGIGRDGQLRVRKDIDLEDVVAWKNGLFRFHGADLGAILRELARWYDVDIQYQGQVSSTISGGISRNVNLSQILHILELTRKVTFSIEGKKIIVLPLSKP